MCEPLLHIARDVNPGESTSLVRVNNDKDAEYQPLDGQLICRRALQSLGATPYHVLCNNCEQFATWCRYDERVSDQINIFASTARCPRARS